MLKFFLLLCMLLSVSALYGKETKVQVLLINGTWLETGFIKADPQGNLTIRLKNAERIIRRKEYKIVKMALPPEMMKAGKLLDENKPREAGKLIDTIAGKYNFPPVEAEIRVMQGRVKLAEADPQAAESFLEPLMKAEITMPELEAPACAHGFLLLGRAYEELNQPDKAAKAYRRSFELAVPEYSALANLTLGKMLLKQKKTHDALDCFLENVSVFSPGTPGHKKSLEATIDVYKKAEDKKAKLYEDILKKDYPLKKK